jgi:hypothetical protein
VTCCTPLAYHLPDGIETIRDRRRLRAKIVTQDVPKTKKVW